MGPVGGGKAGIGARILSDRRCARTPATHVTVRRGLVARHVSGTPDLECPGTPSSMPGSRARWPPFVPRAAAAAPRCSEGNLVVSIKRVPTRCLRAV